MYWHIFGELNLSKADHMKAKGESKELGISYASQSTISNYFQCTARSKANQACAHRQERYDLMKVMLRQATFKYPKLHLLTHCAQQIILFELLPQYSTEIIEAHHKPLKGSYRWSNHVDATPQILDSYARGSAYKMLEFNLYA